MIPLMQYVDMRISNEEDAEKVLGFEPENTDVTKRASNGLPPRCAPSLT